MKTIDLICTGCAKRYEISRLNPRCDDCGEVLEVPLFEQGAIKQGNPLLQTVFDRYTDFFPFAEHSRVFSLGEGKTPLVNSPRLASELGIRDIFFKNETQNPTWSFKDRGTASALGHAAAIGCGRIGAVSTGNMAVSTAAYGVRAGLETIILVSSDIPEEKLGPIAVHGSLLIRVDGDYGDLYYESIAVGVRRSIYFMNSDAPFRVEGYKTISFEICEQTAFDPPDYVVTPTSAGGNIRGIIKGFEEFRSCGLIDRIPVFVCAQAVGCAPIYEAFRDGKPYVTRWPNPSTIAHAMENPAPPSGNQVLRKLRQTNGMAAAVSDAEIIKVQRRLAEEGIFAQPAAAAPLAAVARLRAEKKLDADARVACIITGSGLKYPSALKSHAHAIRTCSIRDLEGCIEEGLSPA
jgi:threonine synthase